MSTNTKPKGLADKAMLVSLTISQWVINVADRAATLQFSNDHSVNQNSCTVRKRLLPRKGAVVKLQTAVSALRKYHSHMTLPWTKGVGILPSSKYTEYSSKMRELINDFKAAKKELIIDYPNLKNEAKQDLNIFWSDMQYPDTNVLDGKFDVHIDVVPVPQKGDWRIDLVDDELDKLDQELEKREEQRIQKANQELWERLYEPIKHMVEVLSKDKPKIFKTLITNILDLTAILPDLNLTEDPKLEDLRIKIEDQLCEFSVTELKESPFLREKVAEKAEEIRQKIKQDGGITDDDVIELMSGYTGNEIIKEFGEPVVGQNKIDFKEED